MNKLKEIIKLGLFFIMILITSCVNEPVDSALTLDNTNTGTDGFKVNFAGNGKTFVATSVQAIVNEDVISISATRLPNGDSVQIELLFPYNKVGTYTWKSVSVIAGGEVGLTYIPSNGAVPYTSERKDSSFRSTPPEYTDTASITISKIDDINKTISGTFQFTGVRFKNLTDLSIETKILTNGSFTDIPF